MWLPASWPTVMKKPRKCLSYRMMHLFDIRDFSTTETDTEVGINVTEKNRKPTKDHRISVSFRFFGINAKAQRPWDRSRLASSWVNRTQMREAAHIIVGVYSKRVFSKCGQVGSNRRASLCSKYGTISIFVTKLAVIENRNAQRNSNEHWTSTY